MARPGFAYALIAVVGLGLTGAAAWVAKQSYDQVSAERHEAELDSAAFAIRVALDRMAILVRAVRGAYASGATDANDFEIFVRTLTTAESFRSIAFLRRVPEEERAAYDARLITGPDAPDGIWERREDGTPTKAQPRDLHYVVEAGYLSDGTRPAIGFDVASLPDRLAAIEIALDRRNLYLLGPLALPNNDGRVLQFFSPAFDRRGNIIGTAFGTIELESLLNLAAQASGVGGIVFTAGRPPDPETADSRALTHGFEFGQREWTVMVAPRPSLMPAAVPWVVLLVGGAGLASTMALLGFAAAVNQNARLTEARANLRSMLDGLGPLAWLLGPDGTILAANRSASLTLGLSQEQMIGRPFWELARVSGDGPRINQMRRAVATARSSSGVRFDVPIQIGEEEKVFDLWIQPLEAGGTTSLVVSAVDVTDRHEAQQTQQLLTRELDHRMKNALQVIQAVIRRTATTQTSIGSFEKSLSGRVRSMARAHELLADQRWLGADIDTILREECRALDAGGQIGLVGPTLRISPKAALSFALAMHELGTNALKYGALSVAEGQVDLSWTIDRSGPEPRFVLTWEERGGPPVREPTVRGFGSTLIERSIAYELDGTTTVEYRPGGLYCRFSVPLNAVRAFAGSWEQLPADGERRVT